MNNRQGIATVTVNVSALPPPPRPQYAILIDKSIAEIHEFVRRHPKCFVFPYSKMDASDRIDYSGIADCDPLIAERIMQPFYVAGNIDVKIVARKATESLLQKFSEALGQYIEKWEEVIE